MDTVFEDAFGPGTRRRGSIWPHIGHGADWRGAVAALCGLLFASQGWAGGPEGERAYHVEAPIVRGNLAVFPVTADASHDTSQFLTLDEGIRSGQVTVTEAGDERGMIRPGQPAPHAKAAAPRSIASCSTTTPRVRSCSSPAKS